MAKLCSQEEERHSKVLGIIADRAQSTRDKLKKKKVGFLSELSKTVKTLMHTMDIFIYSSEVTGQTP